MIGADEPPSARAARLAGDLAGAVAADIVEAADDAVLAAHGEDALAQNIQSQIIAGPRHVVEMADNVPGLREDLLALDLEEALVGIEPGGEGNRLHAGFLKARRANGRAAT